MSENLPDATYELLYRLRTRYIYHGYSLDEAQALAVQKIRQQFHGSRPDLVAMLIDEAVSRVRTLSQTETRWH